MFRNRHRLHFLLRSPVDQFFRGAPAVSVLQWSSTKNRIASRRLCSVAPTCQGTPTGTIKDIALHHPGIAKVVLKKGKTQLFRDGSPMVYSGAVDCVIGKPPQTGDAVLVTDRARQPFAWGIYNSVSMFCVRIMQMEDEAVRDPSCVLDMERIIQSRVAGAVELRKQLDLPSKDTNVYRLVNSEGDRLSGLIADVLGDQIVVASSASWVEKYRHTIEGVLSGSTGLESITWRPSLEILKEEGLELDAEDPSKPSTELAVAVDEIEVVENGIRYKASLNGQKTGFYADQRDSRLVLRALCRNKTVLDLCCYSGGFSLNAVVGGASHVTGVDSSGPALELATANAALNQLDPSSCTFVKADITPFLKEAVAGGRSWDVVVLDPPKLAPNKKALQRALSRYRTLNSLAMQVTRPGGLLMTCSCSGAVTQTGSFVSVLKDASTAVGRRLIQLRYAGAAADHTLDMAYPEGAYLTNVLLRVL
ncbi:unnamed protein product [Calypogeia fissa]